MANPLDLSKFKKVRVEKDHTVLRHPQGHEIRVLHKPLSPEVHEQLKALPMADGGKMYSGLEAKNRTEGFKKADARGNAIITHQTESHTRPVHNPKLQQSHIVDPVKMSDGGPTYRTDTDEEENTPARQKARAFVGGETSAQTAARIKQQADAIPNTQQVTILGGATGSNYANGGQPTPTPTPTPPSTSDVLGAFRGAASNPQQAVKNARGYAYGGAPDTDASHAALAEAVKNLSQKYNMGPEQAANVAAGLQSAHQPSVKQQIDTAYDQQQADYQSGLQNLAGPNFQAPQQQPAAVPNASPDQSAAVSVSPSDQAPPVASSRASGISAPIQGTLQEQVQGNVESSAGALGTEAANTRGEQAREAGIYGKLGNDIQSMHQEFADRRDQIHQQFEDTAAQVAQGMDPTRWWSSKDTGPKVMTAIGMILGGLATGAGGHPELAAKGIQVAIDRDIDAQKTNLTNKQNLMSKYMEQYNNLSAAEQATRLTLTAAAEGMIKQQAAKLNSANAMAGAQLAVNQLRQGVVQEIPNLAMGQMKLNMLNGAGNMGADPASQIRKFGMTGFISPQQQEAAMKELGSTERINKLQEDVEQAARHLDSLVLAGKLTPSARNSDINTFAGILAKEAEGRFNLEEAKTQMQALMPSPLDSESTSKLKAVRRRQFFDSMRVTPTLDSLGIKAGPSGGASGPQEGQTGTSKSGRPIVFQKGQWVYK